MNRTIKETRFSCGAKKLSPVDFGEWDGPHEVHSFDKSKKIVIIKDDKEKLKEFNVAQVKLFLPPVELAHTFVSTVCNAMKSFSSEPPPDPKNISCLECNLVEVIPENDPRANTPEMQKAKQKEIDNLVQRGVFEFVKRSDIPKGANVITSRFVLAIKSPMNAEKINKARYCAGGHKDKMKNVMVHHTVTLTPASVRLLCTLAELLNLDIWGSDDIQAFIQALRKLDRDLFIIDPPPEFCLPPEICLKVVRSLYGICESGDMWHETIDDHHKKDLKMVSSKLDPSLYFKIQDGKVNGISGLYSDDLLRAGNEDFKKVAAKTHEKFDRVDDKELSTEFTGFQVERDADNKLVIKQTR